MNIQPRITIRVSKGSLAFAMADDHSEAKVAFEPYTAKSGVSMAANLRDAFKTADLLQADTRRALVLVDTPTLLIPIEEFREADAETLYVHCYPDTEGATVMSNVLPGMNAVVLFAVNKDLKMVVEDHYQDAKFSALMRPMWTYLHHRSFIGNRRKLFVHFHDGRMEVFSFERSRFIFANSYEAKHTKDVMYFILFVWKQLALDQQKDELYLSGALEAHSGLADSLRLYVEKVSVINPSADFNRAPLTQVRGITFDLLALYLS